MHGELVSVRDTVQSIWVAIVVAFVLRAFLFEAFVIPTGSMAPRLLGEHWTITCAKCGYRYAHGHRSNGLALRFNRRTKVRPPDARCPNCGYREPRKLYIDGGDRVLVLKYLYPFREPQPWEVVVFKNPQNNRENYIKRLIGLPGETLQIVHGDIFVKSSPREPWRIRRKPHRAQEAMWQVLLDSDYVPDAQWEQAHQPPHWAESPPAGLWDLTAAGGRWFTFAGGDQPGRLEFVADRDRFLPHYGYNRRGEENVSIDRDVDVCTDLKLSAVLMAGDTPSQLSFGLTSFNHEFIGRIDTDGHAELLYRDASRRGSQWLQWGQTTIKPIKPGQGVEVALEHADFRVSLWVDGKQVLRSTDQQYSPDYQWLVRRVAEADRKPIPKPRVTIQARGGPCQLRHVRVLRDVYYTCPKLRRLEQDATGEYARRRGVKPGQPGWGTTGNPITLVKDPDHPELDEFFMLGDNSPQSHDGRTWTAAAPTLRLYDQSDSPIYQPGTVPRYNLIGRAFFVYWPSGFRPPGLPGLPLVPNVGRMRLIH